MKRILGMNTLCTYQIKRSRRRYFDAAKGG
jgi:hypothetical protein